jgi:hypothetical protein
MYRNFHKVLVAISHSLLTLVFIYCTYKCININLKLIAGKIPHSVA